MEEDVINEWLLTNSSNLEALIEEQRASECYSPKQPMYSESEARFIMESGASEERKKEQEEVLWYLHDNNEL